LPSVFSKVLAARKANLMTALARKNKGIACTRASARKDHSIPLTVRSLFTFAGPENVPPELILIAQQIFLFLTKFINFLSYLYI